jgi:hypothetical protein
MDKSQIKAKFDRWPNYFGAKVGACDVLVLRTNGKKFYPSNGCHGIMYDIYGTNIKAVYSSLWCRHEDLFEAAKEYWDYLLDPEVSPFRLALKDRDRIYDDLGRPLAFGIVGNDKPNQLAVGVMMQCRVPQENSNKLRAYKLFRDEGFDIPESFFLSEHYYYINDRIYRVNSQYDHAFSATNGISFERLKNGTPTVDLYNNWARTAEYSPVTGVWKGGANHKVWNILNEKGLYKGFFEKAFKREVSADGYFKQHGTASLDPKHAIETLKANRTGW